MANQKEAKVIREAVGTMVADVVKFEDFEFAGFTSEGAAFTNGTDTFVVRTIVKSETFDLEGAIAELVEKQEKARKAAEEKAAKVAKAGK